MSDYSDNYSANKFLEKIKDYGKKLGSDLVVKAMSLYYCLTDPDTPTTNKVIIIAALGYFVCPVDAIPDLLIGVGFIDDASALTAAYTNIQSSIKQEHINKAKGYQ